MSSPGTDDETYGGWTAAAPQQLFDRLTYERWWDLTDDIMSRPHHNRTRSNGEPQGTTVKAPAPQKAASLPFAQVGTRTGRK
ncbi:hypothetical protein [Streptomyces sp. NPDC048191]|uniref:hypothetical protein n=1 Tax=Streptomyces sp. NPDC048191 TaxID=3155484 RepID=UPI0033EE460A